MVTKINSGIYSIENIINGKKYIGQSVHLEKRRREHFNHFKTKTHKNPYFQKAFNKYGEEAFIFKILIYCEPFEMTRYEQALVDLYGKDNLYNLSLKCVTSTLGIAFTEEHKKKISEATKGKTKNKANRKTYKTKVLSETHKKRISNSMLKNKNAKKSIEKQ